MVNEIKVQVCDRCDIISPDVNYSENTCMECGDPLVVAIFTRQPIQPASNAGASSGIEQFQASSGLRADSTSATSPVI